MEHRRPIANKTLEEISCVARRVVDEGLGILAKNKDRRINYILRDGTRAYILPDREDWSLGTRDLGEGDSITNPIAI